MFLSVCVGMFVCLHAHTHTCRERGRWLFVKVFMNLISSLEVRAKSVCPFHNVNLLLILNHFLKAVRV